MTTDCYQLKTEKKEDIKYIILNNVFNKDIILPLLVSACKLETGKPAYDCGKIISMFE